MVVEHWPEIVGEDIAARAVADGYRDGVLYVSVEQDVWRQELQMQKETILRKIHELPYGQAVREIRLTGVKKG
jgi:predicted nucleic acid-binding Zn ribbon protein